MFASKKKKKAQAQKENAMIHRKAMEQEEQEEQKARLREKVIYVFLTCVYFNTSPLLTWLFLLFVPARTHI